MSFLPPRQSPSLTLSPAQSVVLHEVEYGLHLAGAAKYLSAAGLVAVLYDHVLTFDEEVRVIWTAPPSIAKWMFLTNRYLSETFLLVAANQMSGFNTAAHSDKIVLCIVFVYSIFSTITANLLAFLRVIVLWDKSPRIVLGLSIVFTLCTLSTIGTVVASVVILKPTIKYDPLAQACSLTKTGPSVIASFAGLTAFELIVLVLTAYNGLSRPRDSGSPLIRALYRDGLLFFVAVTIFRLTNLISVSIAQPAIASIPLFFSWAMVTLAINRLLISLRSSERGSERDDDLDEDVLHSPVPTESDCPNSRDRSAAIELRSFWEM